MLIYKSDHGTHNINQLQILVSSGIEYRTQNLTLTEAKIAQLALTCGGSSLMPKVASAGTTFYTQRKMAYADLKTCELLKKKKGYKGWLN